jgi:Dodecin
MADPIYKVVEVVGTSEQSLSEAIDNAIKPLEHYETSAGSKSRRCAVRSRTARFNATRSL